MFAVDIGNTTTCFGRFRAGELLHRVVTPTDGLTGIRLAEVIDEFLSGAPGGRPARAGIASVVPGKTGIVEQGLARAQVPEVTVMSAGGSAIIAHDLETIETTGVDRLLAARAAWELARGGSGGAIVIQAGSAVTVDLVDAQGVFRGGMILPGPSMWTRALASAAQIPRFDPADAPWSEPRLGRSTAAAVLQGLAVGLSGAVESVVCRLRATSPAARVFITGGWAEALQGALPGGAEHHPDLVLHGIRWVLEEAVETGGE